MQKGSQKGSHHIHGLMPMPQRGPIIIGEPNDMPKPIIGPMPQPPIPMPMPMPIPMCMFMRGWPIMFMLLLPKVPAFGSTRFTSAYSAL